MIDIRSGTSSQLPASFEIRVHLIVPISIESISRFLVGCQLDA